MMALMDEISKPNKPPPDGRPVSDEHPFQGKPVCGLIRTDDGDGRDEVDVADLVHSGGNVWRVRRSEKGGKTGSGQAEVGRSI